MLNFKFISQETRNKLCISVVNMSDHIPTEYDYYIGRPSILSNPYTHKKYTKYAKILVNSRDESISSYEQYFNENIRNEEFRNEITKILELYKKHNKLNLVCFCKPKSCHGDFIKKYLENKLLNI